jgi:hypothetical protein
MSSYDRLWEASQIPKKPFDQILTSWFLDAPAKSFLSAHFLRRTSLQIFHAKTSCGVFEHDGHKYLPLFYQGKIPASSQILLSFRKLKHPKWEYGYVMVREWVERSSEQGKEQHHD